MGHSYAGYSARSHPSFCARMACDSASFVVKELKGMTPRYLREEFHAVLSKLPSMWTGSYFASTAGAVSAQTIQRSIDAQKGV